MSECKKCLVPFDDHYYCCGECKRYLSLLRRVIELTRLTVERCQAGYSDVAEFLMEEEARKG